MHPGLAAIEPLMLEGRLDEALAAARRLQQRSPRDPEIMLSVGQLLLMTGQAEAGAFSLSQAANLAPARRAEIAGLLLRFDRPKEAKVLFIASQSAIGIFGLILCHIALDETALAERLAQELAGAPGQGLDVLEPLIALARMNNIEGVIALTAKLQAAAGSARGPVLDTSLLMSACGSWTMSATEVAKLHADAGRALVARAGSPPTDFPNSRDPDRPLVVGVVSQDFRNRSAGHFAEPIFAHIHPTRVKLIAYSNTPEHDDLTDRIQQHATWVDIRSMTDAQLVRRIRDDRIDILLDLSGHTTMGRLGPFAARAAPVQATYMGYPNTTGLPAMDARIVDALTDPLGSESLATERLVRLDGCFLCYAPPPHAPAVAPGPLARGGPLTFGSFNALHKITPPVLDLWAQILLATPRSKLLLKNGGLSDPLEVAALHLALAQRGVARSRVVIKPPTATPAEHLAAYADVDIALDTYPYHGTTTTLEALWMGVPVVTLAGDRHVARVGVSLLNNIGLSQLVAADPASYTRIAAALGADTARLAEWRGQLRPRLAASVICDGPGFGRRFEAALRGLWHDWCRRS